MGTAGEFLRPPEAPTFYPTLREFSNPIAYISSILPRIQKYGICKIKSPQSFKPVFNLNLQNSFVPREQNINELNITNRFRYLFNEKFHTFWQCRGIKCEINKECNLDVYLLHMTVIETVGVPKASIEEDTWTQIFAKLNCPTNHQKYVEQFYNKYVIPFLEFHDEMQIDIMGSNLEPSLVPSDGIEKQEELNMIEQCETSNSPLPDRLAVFDSEKEQKYVYSFFSPSSLSLQETFDEELTSQELPQCPKCRKSFDSIRTSTEQSLQKVYVKTLRDLNDKYGFEDGERAFTISEFSTYNECFMEKTFGAHQNVSIKELENRYWKAIDNFLEQTTVYYGADIEIDKFGSGFVRETDNFSGEDQELRAEYAKHPWNVNNFATHEDSVLQLLGQRISGVTVPWLYVGMCFSSFCWHVEDHWTYSVNYHHYGATKVWYGVAGKNAKKLEKVASELSPEISSIHPDIIHHMTAMINPTVLLEKGIPVFTVHQEPGDFVITLPRAYHSGFNAGVNVNEAVNFAPRNWLQYGRLCNANYSKRRRPCVFSFDELIMRMATAIVQNKFKSRSQTDVLRELLIVCDREGKSRTMIRKLGVVKKEQTKFESFEDESRCCSYCQTTFFHSAVQCEVHTTRQVCPDHVDRLCKSCPPNAYLFRYRYSLSSIAKVLSKLKKIVLPPPTLKWLKKVKEADTLIKNNEKFSFARAQQICDEGALRKYPTTAELTNLKACVKETLKWVRKVFEHQSPSRDAKALKADEYRFLAEKLFNCPLVPSEELRASCKEILTRMDEWSVKCQKLRSMPIDIDGSLDDLEYEQLARELISQANGLCIDFDDLPEINKVLNFVQMFRSCKELKERIEKASKASSRELIDGSESDSSTEVIEKADISKAIDFLAAFPCKSRTVTGLLQFLEPIETEISSLEHMCKTFAESQQSTYEIGLKIMSGVDLYWWCKAPWLTRFRNEMTFTATRQLDCQDLLNKDKEIALDYFKDLRRKGDYPLLSTTCVEFLWRYECKLKIFIKYMAELFTFEQGYHSYYECIGGREDLNCLAEGNTPPLYLTNLADSVFHIGSMYQYNEFKQMKRHLELIEESHVPLMERLRQVHASRLIHETCQCGTQQTVSTTLTCYNCRSVFHTECINWEPALGRLPRGLYLCQRCLRGKRPSISAVENALNNFEEQFSHSFEFKLFAWVLNQAKMVCKELLDALQPKKPLPEEQETRFEKKLLRYLMLECYSPSVNSRLNNSPLLGKRWPVIESHSKILATLKDRDKGKRVPKAQCFGFHLDQPIEPENPKKRRRTSEESISEEQEQEEVEDEEYAWHDSKGDPRVRLCEKGEDCLKPFGSITQWVRCDGQCKKWLHYVCAGVTINTDLSFWLCHDCAKSAQKSKNNRKRRRPQV